MGAVFYGVVELEDELRRVAQRERRAQLAPQPGAAALEPALELALVQLAEDGEPDLGVPEVAVVSTLVTLIIPCCTRGSLTWRSRLDRTRCMSSFVLPMRLDVDILTLYLFHDVGFDDVALALVVELFYLDAALVAGGDFLYVVLEAAQGGPSRPRK